nr:MAG: ORF1 [TTV-like mini virus]
MRYWRRNPYRWRRRRPRYYWKRRFRRPIWRRIWRRRYGVRKRKLRSLKIRQWQPHYIKRLHIKGYYPMFLCTNERVGNNLNCYLESTAPHKVPGGGGFQIFNFNLNMLYEEHLIAKNWWTTGNDNMPLIRYLFCKITCYREENVDYLVCYNNSYPMNATKLTYLSTHPQAMLLNKHTRIIRCKRNNRHRKPYKTIKIRPPTQMQNQWYFQKDLAFLPLLQIFTTCCSLDRMFLNSNAISTTTGFISLDTNGWKSHYFPQHSTAPYEPVNNQLLFGIYNGEHDLEKIKIGDLVLLGNAYDNQEGTPIDEIRVTATGTPTEFQQKLTKAKNEKGYQGNPFHHKYFFGDQRIIYTIVPWDTIYTTYTKADDKLKKTHFRFQTQDYIYCRYNPFKDKGQGNKIYLVNTDSGPHLDDWTPPTDEDILTENIPLWLGVWGYLDFQRKCSTTNTIDNKTIFVIKSPYIVPNSLTYFVPLDQTFLDGHSPYEDHLIPSDYYGWHPKVRFQVQSVNKIALCGPAVVKLPEETSVEGHIKYDFYFKVGGQPAPMSTLTAPDKQPKWITPNNPNNLIQNTSLQNPTTPFEYTLYNFDERRGQITKKATQRITTHKETETPFLPITDPSSLCPVTPYKEPETTDSSETEEEETSVEAQLLHQRREQKLLRKRINKLLLRLAQLE